MGFGGSRSFRGFLLLLVLALSGCPFSAPSEGDGDDMNAGAGGSAGSAGTSGDSGGGTGGASAGTGGTGGIAGTGGSTGNTGGTGGSAGDGGTGGSPSADDDPLLIPECGQVGQPTDPLQIVEAHLDGHTLFVTVQHSGGCAQHEYTLCQSPDWTGSDPAEAALSVLHDAMGDSCEALITQELTFDLRVLGSHYENRFGKRAGSIELSLGGTVLLYTFDLDADEPDPDFADLDAQLEQANHCESLDECVAVHVAPCGTRFVSSSEDVDALQAALDAWAEAEGLGGLACLAVCHCGVLTCTEGKCTTADDSDCQVAESPTERMVCL